MPVFLQPGGISPYTDGPPRGVPKCTASQTRRRSVHRGISYQVARGDADDSRLMAGLEGFRPRTVRRLSGCRQKRSDAAPQPSFAACGLDFWFPRVAVIRPVEGRHDQLEAADVAAVASTGTGPLFDLAMANDASASWAHPRHGSRLTEGTKPVKRPAGPALPE